MIVNGLTTKQALKLCNLTDTVPTSTVYSRIKKGREKGIYNNEIRKEQQRKRLVIEVIELDDDSRASQDDNVSPLTATTIDSFVDEDTTSVPSLPSNVKKTRKSPRQASVANLHNKRVRLDYDGTAKHSKIQPTLLHQRQKAKQSKPCVTASTKNSGLTVQSN